MATTGTPGSAPRANLFTILAANAARIMIAFVALGVLIGLYAGGRWFLSRNQSAQTDSGMPMDETPPPSAKASKEASASAEATDSESMSVALATVSATASATASVVVASTPMPVVTPTPQVVVVYVTPAPVATPSYTPTPAPKKIVAAPHKPHKKYRRAPAPKVEVCCRPDILEACCSHK
ncbi:hypothetical protein HY620_02560 [Candidatus Uhrbacteria bacterium]|nr:hypothetical protein [Candidatus Uhrbacteria bacterium]